MDVLQIIGGALLLASSLIIIVLVLLQESKDKGLSGAISGGSTESYLDSHGNRTKDAQLSKITKFAAIAFFLISIAINIIAVVNS